MAGLSDALTGSMKAGADVGQNIAQTGLAGMEMAARTGVATKGLEQKQWESEQAANYQRGLLHEGIIREQRLLGEQQQKMNMDSLSASAKIHELHPTDQTANALIADVGKVTGHKIDNVDVNFSIKLADTLKNIYDQFETNYKKAKTPIEAQKVASAAYAAAGNAIEQNKSVAPLAGTSLPGVSFYAKAAEESAKIAAAQAIALAKGTRTITGADGKTYMVNITDPGHPEEVLGVFKETPQDKLNRTLASNAGKNFDSVKLSVGTINTNIQGIRDLVPRLNLSKLPSLNRFKMWTDAEIADNPDARALSIHLKGLATEMANLVSLAGGTSQMRVAQAEKNNWEDKLGKVTTQAQLNAVLKMAETFTHTRYDIAEQIFTGHATKLPGAIRSETQPNKTTPPTRQINIEEYLKRE